MSIVLTLALITAAQTATSTDRTDRTDRTEVAVTFGLSQPVLLHGFNAAADLRYGRFVLTYSHGLGLDYGRAPGALSDDESRAGLSLQLPLTTGFGVGVTLIDELYVLADFKLHHFRAQLGDQSASYNTFTTGVEVGWRFFLWKGLHVTPVLRYWPNVWSDVPEGGIRFTQSDGTVLKHEAAKQGIAASGLFANVLIGWAFEL